MNSTTFAHMIFVLNLWLLLTKASHITSPKIQPAATMEYRYRGDFNHWQRFLNPMFCSFLAPFQYFKIQINTEFMSRCANPGFLADTRLFYISSNSDRHDVDTSSSGVACRNFCVRYTFHSTRVGRNVKWTWKCAPACNSSDGSLSSSLLVFCRKLLRKMYL